MKFVCMLLCYLPTLSCQWRQCIGGEGSLPHGGRIHSLDFPCCVLATKEVEKGEYMLKSWEAFSILLSMCLEERDQVASRSAKMKKRTYIYKAAESDLWHNMLDLFITGSKIRKATNRLSKVPTSDVYALVQCQLPAVVRQMVIRRRLLLHRLSPCGRVISWFDYIASPRPQDGD